jgi:hypothetical protein
MVEIVDTNPFRRTPTPLEPAEHGEAALLLAQTTLHMLVELRVLTGAQATSVVRTASDVKMEVANMTGESQGRMEASLDLLNQMADSLETDNSYPRVAR